MADKNFRIGATLEVDDKQIKTEFTKAGELAGESVAKGLENQSSDIQDRITDTVEVMKERLEELSNIDFSVNVDLENAEDVYNDLKDGIIEARNVVVDFENELRTTGEEGGEAFEELKSTAEEYVNALGNAQGEVEKLASDLVAGMDEAEAETKETTEALEELNDTANQGISENGGLGKMLKFLTSKEIFNFFYRNLKKLGETLIELSGDGERLATMFEPVKEKLEEVGGYIGKGLVPAVEGAIEEISSMVDELTKVGEDGSTAMDMVQKGVYYLGQAFLGVMKIIKSFGQYLGTQFANLYVLVDAFWRDFYDTAKSVIEGIGDASNWEALGDNIKYGILKGVNEAIGGINNMLNWMSDKLGVDLGSIKTIGPGAKKSFNFGEFEFGRTKEALKDITNTNLELVDEITGEWTSFFKKVRDGERDLVSYTEYANDRIKKSTEETMTGKSGGGKGGGGAKKDSVIGAYELMQEEAKDIWEEMTGLVEDHQKNYDKLTEQINKIGKQYDKLREEAKKTREEAEKSLKNYTDELEKAQGETITDLGQRYVELKKDLIGVDEQMKQVARDLTMEDIQRYSDWGESEYMGYDLKKIIELKEKLDEIKLIEENTTEEQRKSDEFTKETSKTQDILNKLKEKELEIEEKKAVAIEKQAIAQSIMDQGNGEQYIKTLEDRGTFYYDTIKKQREKVQNEDNIEYAKQLESQSENLGEQLNEYKHEKDVEVEILIDTTARKIELENEFHNVFIENVKKQEKELDNLIQKEQQLIDKRREYLSMGGEVHNAYGGSVLSGMASIVGENGPEQIIARQSSYVQPRNASNSYSTVNTNNLSINGLELGNFNTIDDMLDALKERLTYRT